LAARGDLAGAERSFESALELEASNPDALAAMLHFNLERAETDRRVAAKHHVQYGALTRVAVRPYHLAVAASWATYILRDATRGMALAQRAVELDGTSFLGYATLGDAAAALGRFQLAVDAYRAALALSGSRTDATRKELEHRIERIHELLGTAEPIASEN
jgi:cytochrome c-type biogenesis protein CcmH/NrfG